MTTWQAGRTGRKTPGAIIPCSCLPSHPLTPPWAFHQHFLLLPAFCPAASAALNEEAGKLLLEGFEEFAKKARLMTSIHARPKPSVLTAAGGANAVNADGTAAPADGKSAGAAASGLASGSAPAGAKPKPASKLADKKKSLKRL